MLDNGGRSNLSFSQSLAPYLECLLSRFADDGDRRGQPSGALLAAHLDLEPDAEVGVVSTFALGIHAYAYNLSGHRVWHYGSSKEAQPELSNDNLETGTGTERPYTGRGRTISERSGFCPCGYFAEHRLDYLFLAEQVQGKLCPCASHVVLAGAIEVFNASHVMLAGAIEVF